MTHYYHCPYPGKYITEYVDFLVDNKSDHSKFRRHLIVDDLSQVGWMDSLYVFLHGGIGGFVWRDYTPRDAIVISGIKYEVANHVKHFIEPAELVQKLANNGLQNKTIKLKLFACQGAVAIGDNEASGKLFKDALAKNFGKIQVYAYRGYTDANSYSSLHDRHKKVSFEPLDAEIRNWVRAKPHKVRIR